MFLTVRVFYWQHVGGHGIIDQNSKFHVTLDLWPFIQGQTFLKSILSLKPFL